MTSFKEMATHGEDYVSGNKITRFTTMQNSICRNNHKTLLTVYLKIKHSTKFYLWLFVVNGVGDKCIKMQYIYQ